MANMMKLMQQAAKMQKDLEKVQGELANKTVEFSSGGGAVKVVASGDGVVKSIKIDPAVINPADAGLLEDMVLASVNGALKTAKDMSSKEMSKIAADMGLPGLGM
ncbi:MAG: YbaB/EbfC family nucleoid-associated protein [bacterium]